MALQVWLPLRGDTKNYGVSNATIGATNMGYTAGKIGPCMSSGKITIDAATMDSVCSSNYYTIMFWFNSGANTGGSNAIMGFAGNGDEFGTTRRLDFFAYPTINDFHWSNSNCSGVLKGVILTATWTHITFVSDGTSYYVYINGALASSGSTSSQSYNYQYSINNHNWYINDFRLYDHALSTNEVHEIYKSCIVHYDFEDVKSNLITYPYCTGYLESYGFTRTQLSDGDGYNYKLSYTGTGGNTWFNLNTNHFSYTAGKKYYYSCKIRVNSVSNVILQIRASRSSNDWVTNMKTITNTAGDNQWHEYTVYQTINSTYDRSGSTVASDPILEFYTNNCNVSGTSYVLDFDMKDLMVIESDGQSDFIYPTTVIADMSGYNNDGTNNGVTYSTDTKSGKGSGRFTSNTYISFPSPWSGANVSECSIGFWFKLNTNTACQCLFSALGNPCTDAGWLAINTELAGQWWYNSSGYVTAGSANIATGVWHHSLFTFKNGTGTFYLDGVLMGTASTASTLAGTSTYAIGDSYTGSTWNGTPFDGWIADFKIFATALSDADAKLLYESRANIDNKYNLSCACFKEDSSKSTYGILTTETASAPDSYGIFHVNSLTETDGSTFKVYDSGNITTNQFIER